MKNALVKVIANHMKSGARKRTKTPTTSWRRTLKQLTFR
jgi:hypothetical protein